MACLQTKLIKKKKQRENLEKGLWLRALAALPGTDIHTAAHKNSPHHWKRY